MEYSKDLQNAEAQQAELTQAFKKIKKKKTRNLDDQFHDLHDEVFEQIDCLKCANCCKTTSPIFRDVDVTRISKKFKMDTRDFENQYLRRDEDGDLVLKSSPCTFLNEDNTCFIYDVRPQACREYPHTDRKRMHQILDLTLKNTLICPAVSRISLKIMSQNS